jgi:polyribonucleotide nucleotidyltransferase
MEVSKVYDFLGKEVKLSTGKLAWQAQGSVLMELGGTTVLATVTVSKEETQQDFFPLSVEYIEKMYARGAINGSKFLKREGSPSDEAIIKARQVDHSIRSLFPKGFRKPVLVALTVLSYDGENDPEPLAVFGASIALMQSGVPYFGPSSSVVVSVNNDGTVHINPKVSERSDDKAEFLISGVDGKFLNIEGWGKELPEDQMDVALDKAMDAIVAMNKIQNDFVDAVFAEKGETRVTEFGDDIELPAPQEVLDLIKSKMHDRIEESIFQPEKADRSKIIAQIKSELLEDEIFTKEGSEFTGYQLEMGIEYVAKKVLRESILKNNKRRLERGLEQIRPLRAEVDTLKTVHGSAMFERGLTQCLSVVTLGALSLAQQLDDMEGESSKRFMHHYNMPPYASGEAGRFQYRPGRREVGHGAIGENALKHMVPTETDFPYTIRVVSEVLSSNGSTSMAATCASSLALMAAGVPMKAAVAGIGVGLITSDEDENDYRLILDIEGIEDFYGDMDFKVCGTPNGITAIQYENKLRGVKPEILKEAFRLARTGRMQVLDVMNAALSAPRSELSPNAPIVTSLSIDKERIGEFIGPGGKNIRALVEEGKKLGKDFELNIEDDGTILVTASNKAQLDFITGQLDSKFQEATVGEIYTGKVDKPMNYGLFVDVTDNISGLCHVSEIAENTRGMEVESVFKGGETVRVKVIKMERGKISFSMKGIEQPSDVSAKLEKYNKKVEKAA